MNEAKLRKQFKAAEQRVSKAIARYIDFIHGIWVETADGQLEHATPHCLTWERGEWHFREYITDAYIAFYTRGRGQKRLVELWGGFEPMNVKAVPVDTVKRLEDKMEAAFSEREKLFNALEAAGVDTWHEAALWH